MSEQRSLEALAEKGILLDEEQKAAVTKQFEALEELEHFEIIEIPSPKIESGKVSASLFSIIQNLEQETDKDWSNYFEEEPKKNPLFDEQLYKIPFQVKFGVFGEGLSSTYQRGRFVATGANELTVVRNAPSDSVLHKSTMPDKPIEKKKGRLHDDFPTEEDQATFAEIIWTLIYLKNNNPEKLEALKGKKIRAFNKTDKLALYCPCISYTDEGLIKIESIKKTDLSAGVLIKHVEGANRLRESDPSLDITEIPPQEPSQKYYY